MRSRNRRFPRGLGAYSEGDPNSWPQQPGYADLPVFNPPALGLENVWQNLTIAQLIPFDVANVSTLIVTANPRRNGVLVQNQSAAASNLYINFNADAAVTNGFLIAAGTAVLFDFTTPRDDITVFFDNAAPQHGVLVEFHVTYPMPQPGSP